MHLNTFSNNFAFFLFLLYNFEMTEHIFVLKLLFHLFFMYLTIFDVHVFSFDYFYEFIC